MNTHTQTFICNASDIILRLLKHLVTSSRIGSTYLHSNICLAPLSKMDLPNAALPNLLFQHLYIDGTPIIFCQVSSRLSTLMQQKIMRSTTQRAPVYGWMLIRKGQLSVFCTVDSF